MTKAEATEAAIANHAAGIRVFVYGTLKRLHYNHTTINNTDTLFLGCCYIEGPYQMRDMGHFPGVQRIDDPHAKTRIYGEVYRVNQDTLRALDILEGNGMFFTRDQVETPWKKAWMYMIPTTYKDRPPIPDGVWRPNPQEKMFIYSGKKSMEASEYFSTQPEL